MKIRATLLAALAAALLAGCGGGGGGSTSGSPSAAEVAPATTAVFLSVASDVHGDQIQALDDVLQKFPIHDRLVAELRKAIREHGPNVETLIQSVGPQVDVAVLDAATGNVVGFTQPADEAAFEQALKSDKETTWVTARIHGWTAFTDDPTALDAVKDADDHLDDVEAYDQATAALPETALVKAYVAGRAVRRGLTGLSQGTSDYKTQVRGTRWLSAAGFAHDDGVEVQVHVNGAQALKQKPFESTLVDDVPAGVLAAASFDDLGSTLSQLSGVARSIPEAGGVVGAVGPELDRLGKILRHEALLYVRSGNPIPEVTLIAKVDDTAEAERQVRSLIRSLAGPSGSSRPIEVEGVKLTAVDLGPVTIFYGAYDGKLIVTDNANAVRDLKGGGDKLADDKVFTEAKDEAGLPDESLGWVYVNLKDAIPVVEGFAQVSGAKIPAEVDDNLRPLRSALLYGSRDGKTVSFKAFLKTS